MDEQRLLLPPSSHTAQQRSDRASSSDVQLTFMGMTLLLPGSAQLAAGNRRVGRMALRIGPPCGCSPCVASAFSPWSGPAAR